MLKMLAIFCIIFAVGIGLFIWQQKIPQLDQLTPNFQQVLNTPGNVVPEATTSVATKSVARPCTYERETWADGMIVSIEGGKLCDDGKWITPQEIPASKRLEVNPVSGKAPLSVLFVVGEGQETTGEISDGGVYLDFGDGSPVITVECAQDKRKINNACLIPARIVHSFERTGTFTVTLWKGSFGGPIVRAQTTISIER